MGKLRKITHVKEGADAARKSKCSAIIGLGGGSIMDCRMAVAFSACNDGDIFDFIYGKRKGTALPLPEFPACWASGAKRTA